jgi:hypothetical protein
VKIVVIVQRHLIFTAELALPVLNASVTVFYLTLLESVYSWNHRCLHYHQLQQREKVAVERKVLCVEKVSNVLGRYKRLMA